MLEQICYEFRPLFAQKQLRYTLRMEPGIEIRCDVAKMERVFDNLIRNAVSYSYQGGEISIGAVQTDEGAYIQFINDGDTIPAEKLARILNSFIGSTRPARPGRAARDWDWPSQRRSWSCTAAPLPLQAQTTRWRLPYSCPPRRQKIVRIPKGNKQAFADES